jgi:hypothetical protein
MGSDRKTINVPHPNRQIFEKRTKDPTFAERKNKIREAALITKTDLPEMLRFVDM